MTLLHAHFNLRNQQAFQRALDGGSDRGHSAGLSSSGGKSWHRPSALTVAMSCDLNARDWLGRTVLHLACSSTERSGVEYVRRLLAQPAINVNICDLESRWTPLHRALYHGNLAAAILLLQRSDIDTSLKDLEGYTAFDLYNSTVEGTKPSANDEGRAEVCTWGANRNAALGLGDGDDRIYPDQVILHQEEEPGKRRLDTRFLPVEIRQIAMSRLHTVLVTSESHGNIRVCGFGSGGRLGPGQHTQYKFKRLHQFTHKIVSVALGQDHTLALTSSGEVLSWGLNRFSQLGYIVESSTGVSLGKLEEPIQSTPRKVVGPLKKEVVRGVAACKTASACWTDREVYTFGTNSGQLGYDNPIQVVPRKVTKITQPAIAISIADSAMVCLLATHEVICIWKDRHFKLGFPFQAFPSEIQVYRPPQAVKDAHICKITHCDDTFAALSSNGEVFTFTVPNPSDPDNISGKDKAGIKPQCVWALRKQFSAVKDVALGSDGSIIICTESGHVFVRSRTAKTGQGSSAKSFRFQRVPFIQRVTNVCANNAGAFGALRVDQKLKEISTHGKTMAEDLAAIQPYLRYSTTADCRGGVAPDIGHDEALSPTEEGHDPVIQKDIECINRLCQVLMCDKTSRRGPAGKGLFEDIRLPHGANLIVQTQSGTDLPVHRLLLAARSSVLYNILSGSKVVQDQDSKISLKLLHPTAALPRLVFAGCHAMSILILLTYLYSDGLPAIWDRRVAMALEQPLRACKVKPGQVKVELEVLARILDLPLFAQALQSPATHDPPPSLVRDMDRMFHGAQTRFDGTSLNVREAFGTSPLFPDVILQLADRDVACHSMVLRARSVFFADFFDDPDWTAKRWNADGTIHVDMKHLKWRAVQFVLRFLCCGGGIDMFDTLDFVDSLDDVLEFMFEVVAAANELLLDRLVTICSVVILKYSNIANSCYILSDATYFRCEELMESLQDFMTVNMEVLLESRMLEDMTPDLIRQLSEYVRQRQAEKAPVSRSNRLVDAAMRNHAEWLALQDIPQPIVRAHRTGPQRHSPRLSPTVSGRKVPHLPSNNKSLSGSPSIRAQPSLDADIFTMDDTDSLPTLNLGPPSAVDIELSPKPAPAWRRVSSVPRVDMKALMAEVASSNRDEARQPPATRITSFAVPERAPPSPVRFGQKGTRQEAWLAAVEVPEGAGTPVPPRSPAWNWPKPQLTPSPVGPSTSPSPVKSPENARSASTSKMDSSVLGKSQPTPPPQARNRPGLGPVFTPSRQLSKAETSRSGGGRAWTLPPVQPTVGASASPAGPGVSFVAIQQLQLDQDAGPVRDRRSLVEIQEEERARGAEAEFLAWWAAEEARVRAAEGALARPRAGHGRRPRGRGESRVSAAARESGAGRAMVAP